MNAGGSPPGRVSLALVNIYDCQGAIQSKLEIAYREHELEGQRRARAA